MVNEPSLLALYNAAGRQVALLEKQIAALRGENLLLKRRVELLERTAPPFTSLARRDCCDEHCDEGHHCYKCDQAWDIA